MWTRIAILTSVLGITVTSAVQAGEIHVRPDRDHLVQGESATINISVRGATTRPVVTPPTVPYCQVEQVQPMQLKSQLPQRGLAKSPAPSGQLARAFDDLNRQIQSLPGELAKQGFGDAGLLQEYEGMLQGIRKQAQEALQSGNGPKEYEAVYRITPQRAGTLTLTPFILKIGGQSILTKPLTFTIDPAPAKSDVSNAAETTPSKPEKETNTETASAGSRGLAFQPWHGVLALLAAPVLGAMLALLGKRRKARTQTDRQNRQQALAARETLLATLADARNLSTVDEALSEFVRRRCRLPGGAVTPAEAAASLQTAGVSEALANRVAELLEICAASQFAAGSVAVDERALANDASRVIREIG